MLSVDARRLSPDASGFDWPLTLAVVFAAAAVVTLWLIIRAGKSFRRAKPAPTAVDRAQYRIAVGLFLTELALAGMSLSTALVARRSLEIARSSLMEQQVQGSLTREYLDWRVQFARRDDGDIDITLVGTRRSTTAELKCFDLLLLPLYLNTANNTVDDADRPQQPRLRFSCDKLQRQYTALPTGQMQETLSIAGVVTQLRSEYDGKTELERIASTRRYVLREFEVRLDYWHTTDRAPTYSIEGRVVVYPQPKGNASLSDAM